MAGGCEYSGPRSSDCLLLHVHVGKALEEVPKHEAQASRQLRCTVDLDQSLTPDGIASEACDRTLR